MKVEDLLHLPLHEARSVCEKNGFVLQVVRVDGEPRMRTMEVQDNRVNVWTENSKVVKIDGLG